MEERFVRTYSQHSGVGRREEIWTDRDTGVQYLFLRDGYGAGLTPLLDPEGKPLVAPRPQAETP